MRVAAVTAACLLFVSANAGAQAAQKTIQVGTEPDYTIGIPSQLDPVPKSELPDGTLMAFVGSVGSDDFLCQLLLQGYTTPTGRDADLASFKTEQGRNEWCTVDGASNFHALDNEAITSNGLPAATCVAAYTEANGTGKLADKMMIATSKGTLFLMCQVENPSLKDVEAESPDWQASFEDVQQSLHLPAAEK